MSSEGSQGFNTITPGPLEANFDLSPSDFRDLIQTDFGLATFLTNGTWMFKASMAQLQLGGDPIGTLQDGSTFTADAGFDITAGEFSIAYTLYRSPTNKFALRPHIGARYTKHELDLTVVATGPTNGTLVEHADENWTDFLIGTSLDFSLAPRVGLSTTLDGGFGGSNGTFKAASALSWRVRPHISLAPNVTFTTNDFENGTKGDTDWYLFDTNDATIGLALMFIF